MTSFFGLLSLVLSSIGLYGVTAHNAARRTSEIGIRVALGAHRLHVMQLVLRGAFGLMLSGLAIGLPLTFAVGRLLRHQLYGTNPDTPTGHDDCRGGLAGSTLVASLVPGVRASLISPLEALRSE